MQIDLENIVKESLSEKTLIIEKLTYLPFSREFMNFIAKEKNKKVVTKCK
jgi:hypothetical protein